MAISDDIEYYRAREINERAAITHAPCSALKSVHWELAERYADQVWSLQKLQHDARQP